MNEREFAELAAGHALDALTPEDERAFQDARAAHPEWETIVAADAATAARLADAVTEVAPPPGTRDVLLARIAADPPTASPATSVGPADPAGRRRARIGRRGWFALAASIALLVAIGVGAALVFQQLARPAAVVALEKIEAADDAQSAQAVIADGGVATLHWSESLGQAVLVSEGLPSIPRDQAFELWYVRDGTPVAAGVFDASADGTATALLSGAMAPGDTVAVTVEQDGGSPSGQPTTEPIVAIPTA